MIITERNCYSCERFGHLVYYYKNRSIRVEDGRLYLFLFLFLFLSYFLFIFLFLNLELEISMMSHMTITTITCYNKICYISSYSHNLQSHDHIIYKRMSKTLKE